MKLKTTLFLGVTALLFGSAYAQTERLYSGYVRWSSGYADSLAVVDMDASGDLTLIEHRGLNSDAGTVDGCYGLSLDPASGDMYILYQIASEGEYSRRLGTVDTLTGDISDIGISGNLTDIAFSAGGTLYGTTGSDYAAYTFVEVNPADASVTDLFTHAASNYGPGIGYDLYHNRMVKMDRDIVSYIDLSEMSETVIPDADLIDHPGEIHSIFVKNDSIAIVSHYDDLYEFNMNTNTFTFVPAVFAQELHAMATGLKPLAVLVDGPSTFCDNDLSTLSITLEGTDYQWLLDGDPIDGATDATYTPNVSGYYSCIVDGDEAQGRSIVVLVSPVVSYTATPNPVYLSDDPTGTVNFENTTTDGGDTFSWDFDNGFTTAVENPSFAFATVGTYNVELMVTNSENGCSGSNTQEVEVIATAGFNDEVATLFNAYPSSVVDNLTIQFTGENANGYSLSLVDLSGRTITTQALQASGNNTFNMADLESGVYFVKVSKDNKNAGVLRVVKQ